MLMRDNVRWRLLLATGDVRRGSVFLTFLSLKISALISSLFQLLGHQLPDGEDASEVGDGPPALLRDGTHVCATGPDE